MTLILYLLVQETVELKDHGSFYLLHKPVSYAETKSWPVILDVGARGQSARDGADRWKNGGGKDLYLIIALERQGLGKEREAAFARACLDDVKSKFRVDPERVLIAGKGAGADFAARLCASQPELYAGCAALGLSSSPPAAPKMPPFHIVLPKGDREAARIASDLVTAGVDVLARVAMEPAQRDVPKVLEWFEAKARSRGDVETVDRFVEAGRYLDASLVCLGLLDRKDQETLVRARLRKIEAAGIMTLGSVELAMGEGKFLDAWIRCRDGAAQFSWLPVGEKIRRRLGTLESDARVKKARAIED